MRTMTSWLASEGDCITTSHGVPAILKFHRFADDGSNRMTSELPRIAQPWALKNLPPFRPVAAKLLRLTAQDDVPLNKVQQVLRTDVAFSAEVLRLANSALIGSRTGVSSVEHAVGLLGLERLKALSMTIAMRDFFSTPKSNSTIGACWKYNLVTAMICEWLAPVLALHPDACYT